MIKSQDSRNCFPGSPSIKVTSKATVHPNLENKFLGVIFFRIVLVVINLKLILDFSSSRLFYPKGNSNVKPIYHALKNTDLCFSSDYYDVKQFDDLFISHRILFSTNAHCSFIIGFCQGKEKFIQEIILTF